MWREGEGAAWALSVGLQSPVEPGPHTAGCVVVKLALTVRSLAKYTNKECKRSAGPGRGGAPGETPPSPSQVLLASAALRGKGLAGRPPCAVTALRPVFSQPGKQATVDHGCAPQRWTYPGTGKVWGRNESPQGDMWSLCGSKHIY